MQRFLNLAAQCHKNEKKFRQKIHSKWKMWMLDFEQKVSIDADILRYAYDIVLCTTSTNRYFSFIEALTL